MDVTVVDVVPELSVAEQDERYDRTQVARPGRPVADLRKVELPVRALSGYEARGYFGVCCEDALYPLRARR